MRVTTSLQDDTDNESTLEGLAAAHQKSTDAAQQQLWANKTSAFLLHSPAAHKMVRGMLFRKGKIADRLDDALQEATIIFVMKVLPELRNPQAAWGAFKGAVEIVSRRIGSSFYDCERSIITSTHDTLALDGDTPREIQNEHGSVNADDETERAIIDKIVADRAKSEINEALLTAKMNGKNALSWLSSVGQTKDVSASRRPEDKRSAPVRAKHQRRAAQVHQTKATTASGTQELPLTFLIKRTGEKHKAARLADLPQHPNRGDRTQEIEQKKIPVTPEYERLVQIRDLTGSPLQLYADALHIGLPRLRSYLNRRSRVHREVLARAEQWYSKEGILREMQLRDLKSIPLPELIENWKEVTQAPSYAALAGILGISVPTMTRWRKPGAKAMHDSHLLDAASKAQRYSRAFRRKDRSK